MKNHTYVVAVLITIIIPQILFSAFLKNEKKPTVTTVMKSDNTMYIDVLCDDKICTMDLDSYIVGVVLGEMPSEFEVEALKAQAIASRTYTLYKVENSIKHVEADVCSDPACCQAYISTEKYLGEKDAVDRVRTAVLGTKGMVLTYRGKLIDATYFSCSGGRTENAVAVWGADLPYLRAVDSPGEEISRNYESTITMPVDTFCIKLNLPCVGRLSNDMISLTYTTGLGVDQMSILDHVYSGVEVRSLLQLPSTQFTINVTDECVSIHLKGNGHRVGMSQYGAEAMALEGKSCEEILTHYYQGTKLETYTTKQLQAVFDKV